ncbi:MAG TPA: hypothetical protein DEQ09_01565 [Bacteroidales bacterium]|nr:hypothetical protein [Bacteroidales bacterium]
MWTISNIMMIIQNASDYLKDDIPRSEWVFALLILPVLIYLIVSLKESYSLNTIIRIVFSNKYANNVYRNSTPGVEVFQLLLGALSLLSIPTFILFAEFHFNLHFYHLNPFLLWLFNLVVISLAILSRYIVNLAIGSLSRSSDAFREYFFNISHGYKLMGIMLMIVNFFISYLISIPDRYIIFFSLIMISVIYLLRIIRLIYIFLKRRFSLFYLILYLCTLEFFPALILLRYLSGQDY